MFSRTLSALMSSRIYSTDVCLVLTTVASLMSPVNCWHSNTPFYALLAPVKLLSSTADTPNTPEVRAATLTLRVLVAPLAPPKFAAGTPADTSAYSADIPAPPKFAAGIPA
jgi:hypothetical protein